VFVPSQLLQCLEERRNHIVFIGTEQLKPSYLFLKKASEGRPELMVVSSCRFSVFSFSRKKKT